MRQLLQLFRICYSFYGRTSYVLVGGRIQKTIPQEKNIINVHGFENNYSYLKAICVKFKQNTIKNSLQIDLLSMKTMSLSNEQQFLDNINDYVGYYFNINNKTFNVLLYNRKKHRDSILNNSDAITSEAQWKYLTNSDIPLRLCSYSLNEIKLEITDFIIQHTLFPTINMTKQLFLADNALNDLLDFEQDIKTENIAKFLGKTISRTYTTLVFRFQNRWYHKSFYSSSFKQNNKFLDFKISL